MPFRFFIKNLLVLPVLVLASSSDPTWGFNEDSFSASSNLPLDQMVPSLDWKNLLEDENTVFEDLDNDSFTTSFGNDPAVDDGFDLLDCTSFGNFPLVGKSRVRRLYDSNSCKNTDATSPTGTDLPAEGDGAELDLLDVLRSSPTSREWMMNPPSEDDQNSQCALYSSNLLPWGVCSLGRWRDEINMHQQLYISGRGSYTAWSLYYFTIGMLTPVLMIYQHQTKTDWLCIDSPRMCSIRCSDILSRPRTNTMVLSKRSVVCGSSGGKLVCLVVNADARCWGDRRRIRFENLACPAGLRFVPRCNTATSFLTFCM